MNNENTYAIFFPTEVPDPSNGLIYIQPIRFHLDVVVKLRSNLKDVKTPKHHQ